MTEITHEPHEQTVLVLPLPPGYDRARPGPGPGPGWWPHEVHTAAPGDDELRARARLHALLGVRPAPAARGGWA
ncbi:hypothetical protein E0L36_13875 [Streptomyces sp. AJS327]|uniref:hypothetical protein n=1 Tax=Streptomyces sp. AJS327 TaxID=2545265 RepID=UPI0015DEAB72|nr:hypothetical protein [Streptomyces sp. AJS327]MBA0051944.1 hypothetical protein [Streptomyces sp. AJS327]